jgi:hypothetical protein
VDAAAVAAAAVEGGEGGRERKIPKEEEIAMVIPSRGARTASVRLYALPKLLASPRLVCFQSGRVGSETSLSVFFLPEKENPIL